MHHGYTVLDGSGDSYFQRALSTYLRNYVGNNKIKKFRFVDSEKDNLIQLADMVAGAIARSYNPNRGEPKRWLDILNDKRKIKDIWNFN